MPSNASRTNWTEQASPGTGDWKGPATGQLSSNHTPAGTLCGAGNPDALWQFLLTDLTHPTRRARGPCSPPALLGLLDVLVDAFVGVVVHMSGVCLLLSPE